MIGFEMLFIGNLESQFLIMKIQFKKKRYL